MGGPTADHIEPPTEEKSEVVAVSAIESSIKALELTERRRSALYRGLIGKTLDGRYRIESVLGEGGMGIVFLAKHVVIEKAVAVKVLKKDASKSESIAKRFVREAQAASRIAHPNIIDVTDFGTTENGITYSVMEYVEGKTLSKTIHREAPIPVERVIRIAVQMTRALDAAHKVGVVHRDLKPENVFLVDRDGRRDFVKIVDFGIARVLPIPGNSEVSRLTRVGTVFGTPEYMAPEQAAGRSDTDHRVDIYALGTIMYEMLSGEVPHKGDSTVRTLAMQMLDSITPLSQLPKSAHIDREVEAVVMKALEKKRENRWQDMGEMLQALVQLTDDAVTLRESGIHAVGTETLLEGPATEVDEPNRSVASDSTETNVVASRTLTTSPTEIYRAPSATGEPAFVRRPRRPSIDDLQDEEPYEVRKRGRGGIVILGLAVVAAVAATVVFIIAQGPDRTFVAPDKEVIAEALSNAAADGGTSEVLVADAGELAIAVGDADPGKVATPTRRRRDGGGAAVTPRGRDAGELTSLGPPVRVEVLTRPTGGTVWHGDDYAGSSGVVITRARGTELKLRCSKAGYKSGYARVRFNDDEDVIVCKMKKKTKCVEDLKNPYTKCP